MALVMRSPDSHEAHPVAATELGPLALPAELPHPNELYLPVDGVLTPEFEKTLRGGSVKVGSYQTYQASHRVGIYEPEGYDPLSPLPAVLMTTPLASGVRGHNQNVAEEMMRDGFLVIKKGPPRYPGFTLKALTLTEDVNQMFGLLNATNQSGVVGEIQEIFVYGESQAAMKALGALGLAGSYGYEVVDALVVAACYLKKANPWRPDKQVGRMADMAVSSLRFIRNTTPERRQQLRGTLSIKDMHHHATVLPVLLSGETGQFLPFIPTSQKFAKELYEKDGHSHPFQVKNELESRFPNVSVRILPEYGHVDGIMSDQTAALRGLMLFEIAKARDARVASRTTNS